LIAPVRVLAVGLARGVVRVIVHDRKEHYGALVVGMWMTGR
jgi:hypothetical protein